MGRASLLHSSLLQGPFQGPASCPGPTLLPDLGREGAGGATKTLYISDLSTISRLSLHTLPEEQGPRISVRQPAPRTALRSQVVASSLALDLFIN